MRIRLCSSHPKMFMHHLRTSTHHHILSPIHLNPRHSIQTSAVLPASPSSPSPHQCPPASHPHPCLGTCPFASRPHLAASRYATWSGEVWFEKVGLHRIAFLGELKCGLLGCRNMKVAFRLCFTEYQKFPNETVTWQMQRAYHTAQKGMSQLLSRNHPTLSSLIAPLVFLREPANASLPQENVQVVQNSRCRG